MTQPKIDGVGHGVPRMLYASDGSNWYAILVDSDGHVKIDVVSTALPTDAATATNQATMITALQLIDDLRAALGSVATDKILVASKSGDKIFSLKDTYAENKSTSTLAAGSNNLDGSAVPAGEIWVVTSALGIYTGTVPSMLRLCKVEGTTNYDLLRQLSPTSAVAYSWQGHVYLKEGNFMRCRVSGATLNDSLEAWFHGYKMNS